MKFLCSPSPNPFNLMKWIKLEREYDGKAAGTVAQYEDGEAAVLVKSMLGKETDAPAPVDEAVQKAQDALVKSLADKIVEPLLKSIDAKTKGLSKTNRPNYQDIRVNPDNALEDPTDGFKSLNEFANTVRKACTGQGLDKRLELKLKANGASENVAADGGYATPVEYSTTIYNDIVTQDSLLPETFTIPMTSNSIKLPAINYTTQGQFGVTAYWEGEGAAVTTSKPKYRQPQLTLNKLFVLTPVTSELLEDGIAVESMLSFLASEAITYKVNESILFGTGAGQPTGIIGHASTAVVSRTTANLVKAQDAINMQSAFMGNDARGQWLINKGTVEPQLLQMQDPGGRYLYFAPGSFANDPRGRLLGKTVRPIVNAAALGSSGDITLVDLKGYAVGFKSTGVNKAMSIHLYFNTDEVAYRWTFRMDGRPWRDTTLAAAKGTGTYGMAVSM